MSEGLSVFPQLSSASKLAVLRSDESDYSWYGETSKLLKEHKDPRSTLKKERERKREKK